MITLKLFLCLLIPVVTGQALLSFLFGKKYLPLSLSLALAYGLGMGLLTQLMLLLGILKVPFSVGSIGSYCLLLAVIFFWLSRRKQSLKPPLQYFQAAQPARSHPAMLFFLIIFILIYSAIALWLPFHLPVYAWDVLATIAFKAKIFFYERGLVPLSVLPHPSYPLYVPFTQTWIALNLGEWNDVLINVFLSFTFGAFLIIFYQFLRFFTTKTVALLGVALLISSHQFTLMATVPMRELSLIYYNCTAVILLILWQKKQVDGFLILAGLFSGFATSVKLEGMGYMGVHLALLCLMLTKHKNWCLNDKIKKSLKFLIPCLAIFLFYWIYKKMTGSPDGEKMTIEITWDNFSRIPVILEYFATVLFFSGNWNIIWFLLINSLFLIGRRKPREEVQWLATALGLFFGLYVTVNFLMTETFLTMTKTHTPDIIPRVILHFYPLAPILIILLNFSSWKETANS